jgi:beta-xylosidase
MSHDPIISGYFPDPSICRSGDEFFLVSSSFEYFPALPIHRSRDLMTWELVGHVFPDPAPFHVPAGIEGASHGFYAATLRRHDGRYWVVSTAKDREADGHVLAWADDPAGPWSDPRFIAGAVGIDPDLVWDLDGTCYLTWKDETNGVITIVQAEVDLEEGRLATEPRSLWSGSGLAHPEGPHLYLRDGLWYLVIAEGGTGAGHGVSVARSRSVTGPFEPHPRNPVLTRRSTSHPVQNVGHADLVELTDGSWAAVHLGVRTLGPFPRFHVLGRETFLTGLRWIDDWPVFDGTSPDFVRPSHDLDETFDDLGPHWISPSRAPQEFASTDCGTLRLAPSRRAASTASTAVLATRARDHTWRAECRVSVGNAALVVRIDDAHWFGIELLEGTVRARMVVGPLDSPLGPGVDASGNQPTTLVLTAEKAARDSRAADVLTAAVHVDGHDHVVARVDGRYISTEVAGGFTGRVIGLEALDGHAVITGFTLRSPDPSARRSGPPDARPATPEQP